MRTVPADNFNGPRPAHRLSARTPATFLLALSLAGCDLLTGGAKPPAEGPARMPEAACTQVETTLRTLQETVMIDFGAAGEATIEQAAWQAMGRAARDQVVDALAVRAACAIERPPAEQSVTIRNEANDILTERSVQVWEPQPGD